jgi:ATP-dependent protease La (LON) substrate-binding domain
VPWACRRAGALRQARCAFVATVGARWLSGSVAVLAMFPLASVLFPYMPLRLRVFEERYLIMLAELLRSEDARFGVVLIERGREVGGGEKRFSVGTIAEITQLGAQESFVGLLAQGSRRFEVTEWLDDAPHPRADVSEMAELEWDDGLWHLRRRLSAWYAAPLRLPASSPRTSGQLMLSYPPIRRRQLGNWPPSHPSMLSTSSHCWARHRLPNCLVGCRS